MALREAKLKFLDQPGSAFANPFYWAGIVLIGDTLVHEWPSAEDLALIARRGAGVARALGIEPRVAFVSFSTYGYPVSERAEKMHLAPQVLVDVGDDVAADGDPVAQLVFENMDDRGESLAAIMTFKVLHVL